MSISYLVPVHRCNATNPGDSVYYHNNHNSDMKIALTFDDGPHPRYTPKILDILDRYGIKATFFVIGVNARDYTNTLTMVSERGHEIANHTYSHFVSSKGSTEKLKDEIIKCEEEIFSHTDCKTKLFRPPEGCISGNIESVARELDYNIILWNIDTKDWAHTPPEKIAHNVISNIKSGDIILMHDFIGKNSPTPEALELFIPELINMGYQFVTVGELMASS